MDSNNLTGMSNFYITPHVVEEVPVENFTVLLAHTLVHSTVHLFIGDWFVGARWMSEHLVYGVAQHCPECVPVVLWGHPEGIGWLLSRLCDHRSRPDRHSSREPSQDLLQDFLLIFKMRSLL